MAPKVLIVDDDEDMLVSTQLVLEHLGYEVVTVRDAVDVPETVAREQPGLILQDLKMDNLNLSGLLASLRTDPATADIPIVFFSGQSDLERKARRHGVWGWLSKPFSEEELKAVLDKAFGTSPSSSGPPERFDDARREVRGVLHDQKGTYGVLTNYLRLLQKTALTPEQQRLVDGIENALLKLEARTEHLRSYLLHVLDQDEAPMAASGA